MRSGVFISVVSHIALVALALFGTPKLFDNPTIAAIEVDLVRSEDVAPLPEKPPEKPPEKEKPAPWDPLPRRAEAQPQASTKTAETRPEVSQQAALTAPTAPGAATNAQPPQKTAPSIFDPANIPALLDLPNAPEKGFDSEATSTANLADDEKANFKAHLKKCWKLPGDVSSAQSTRVVLRVYLQRDGRLASEPVLIEAPASRDGPALLKTAIRTLKDCQPYGFLPVAKYREWKVLDLSFSPREMAGG